MSEIHTFPLGCIVGDIEAMSEGTHLLLGEGQILSHRCIHEVMFCWKLCLYLEKKWACQTFAIFCLPILSRFSGFPTMKNGNWYEKARWP